jgi:solute:Na+ symporter, SSS family
MNRIVGFILLLFLASGHSLSSNTDPAIQWSMHSQLPPPPSHDKQHGLAGTFSGLIDNHLVVLGGANFPDRPPWEGGVRSYWSDAYVLSTGKTEWRVIGNALPDALAYGVAISLPEGLLIIGGMNDQGMHDGVFLLQFDANGDGFRIEEWPSLPQPLAYMSGALIGNEIYVAGGQSSVVDGAAGHNFFMLNLRNRQAGWQALPAWPGPARAFAVAATQSDGFDNCFYLFSGRNYGPDRDLDILSDGYVYNPRLKQWRRLDTPEGPFFPVMAGMAFASGVNHIVLLGGDNGERMLQQLHLQNLIKDLTLRLEEETFLGDSIELLRDKLIGNYVKHTGFSRDFKYYHTITNTIEKGGELPYAATVTSSIVRWNNHVFILSGEISPGVRTPDVLLGQFQFHDTRFGVLNYLVIIVYFLVLIGIGWFFSKRQKNTNDYFKGGGRVPWWIAGLSIFGTALSAITFMAIPAKAYATDWSYLLFNAGIVLVAPIIILLFIPFYRKLNITTAYEYLEQRFNVAVRSITSITFIVFQVGRMGVVLFLPSIALNVVTGIDIFLCISLMGVFSLIYTMSGGIEAVVWTDALQVVVLLGGAIAAVILISLDIEGGFMEIIRTGAQDRKFHLAETSLDLKNPTLITVLIATMFANMTTYGTDQTIVQRYLTTATQKDASRSVITNAVLTIPASLIFFFVGTALYVFFKKNPLLISPVITDPDAIFPWYIFSNMPAGLSGLLIAGIFAAAMSTLSSSMNSSATAYIVDIHYRFRLSKDITGLKIPRLATLIIGLAGIAFGMMMATWEIKSLWDEFQKILGLVLGGLGGLFLLGLLTKRANGTGAIIGILGSIVVQLIISQGQHLHLLLYAASGFISCFVIGYVASLFVGRHDKKIDHLTVYGMIEERRKKLKS